MTRHRDNGVRVSALFRVGHKVSEVAILSHSRQCDQEAHGRWRRCQQTCRLLSKDGLWSVTVHVCARHPNKVCDLIHYVTRTKKCRISHSIVFLQCHFEIHNNKKSFSSMSQSQSTGYFKQTPDNNCQTTPIVTKILFNYFRPSRYIVGAEHIHHPPFHQVKCHL